MSSWLGPSLSVMETPPVVGPQPYDSTRPGVDHPKGQEDLRVRVWFGAHLLHDYRAGATAALGLRSGHRSAVRRAQGDYRLRGLRQPGTRCPASSSGR